MQFKKCFLFLQISFFFLFLSFQTTAQRVVINGNTLSASQIRQIENINNIKCQSGRYWYDKVSGLVGYEGYPPFVILKAGYDLGRLSSKASGGNTGVFFNGRELSYEEWQTWSSLNGSMIYQGYYWFDDKGNAGISGNNRTLVNFYDRAAIAQQQYDNNNSRNNNYDNNSYNNNSYGKYSYSNRQGNNGGGNSWGTNNSSGNSDGSTHVISSFGTVLTMPY